MKLTPETVLGEEPRAKGPKPVKEKKKGWGWRKEDKTAEAGPDIDEDELEEDEFEEDVLEDAEPEERRRHPGLKAFLLILVMAAGFGIFAVNIKGFVDNMRLEKMDYGAAKSYDPDYQESLDADPEDFEEANEKRKAAKETQETDGGSKEPDGLDADAYEKASKDDKIKMLSGEVERLRKESDDAKGRAAMAEQELNNAKSLLDASTAREEQLRGELNAVSGDEK